MEWFWTIGNKYEILVDLDLSKMSMKRLVHCKARLIGAIEDNTLPVEEYAFYESYSDLHLHLMIKCKEAIDPLMRLAWENRLCDDMHRNCLNMARFAANGKSWSLLISHERRIGWREPDYICYCNGKHKGEVMENCPIAKQLDCCLSSDFFGKPVYRDEKPILGQIVRV
jgi:hypothetical protein